MTAPSIPAGLRLGLTLAALVLTVAASVRAGADAPPLPPPRPPELGAPGNASPEPSPAAPKGDASSTCLGKLIADGASSAAAAAPPASAEGCEIDRPVRLSSITVEGGAGGLPGRPLA